MNLLELNTFKDRKLPLQVGSAIVYLNGSSHFISRRILMNLKKCIPV